MKIPILMYHEVAIESELAALSRYINRKYIIKKNSFKEHLDLIGSGVYETLTISELRNPQDDVSKAIALTFDDGHAGNFSHAFELLKEFNARATFFVTTNLIGLQNMLSWEQIKEMSGEGMEIGSHTCSHLLLVNVSESKVKEELQKSKDIIEKQTGKQVRSLSFPNGSYNALVNRIAKDCGYENACTSDFGYWNTYSHDFTLPRITAPEEITMFERIINQNRATILKRNAIEQGKRALKGIIGNRLYNNLYMRLFNLREMGEQ